MKARTNRYPVYVCHAMAKAFEGGALFETISLGSLRRMSRNKLRSGEMHFAEGPGLPHLQRLIKDELTWRRICRDAGNAYDAHHFGALGTCVVKGPEQTSRHYFFASAREAYAAYDHANREHYRATGHLNYGVPFGSWFFAGWSFDPDFPRRVTSTMAQNV